MGGFWWSYGLFSCFGDCGACMYVYCCPACAAGEIYEKGDLGSFWVGCILFCTLCPCHPCIVTGPLRKQQGFIGSTWTDTYIFCLCTGCQLTRELREMRKWRGT
eukprot:532797_1